MRIALLLSPIDPDSSAVSARVEALSTLREGLGAAGFRVIVVSDAEGAECRIAEALERVEPDDTLLVHVTGDLGPDATLRLDGDSSLSLRAISEAVSARRPAQLAFLVEMTHEGADGDVIEATDHVESIREALDARARGAWAVIAVRGQWDDDPIAFSRLLLASAAELEIEGRPYLAEAYERVRSSAESLTAAQSCGFVRGATDFELGEPPPAPTEAPPPAMETEAPGPILVAEPVTPMEAEPAAPHAQLFESADATLPPPGDATVPPPANPPPVVAIDPDDAPDLAGLIALADSAQAHGTWEHAIAGYRAALVIAATSDDATRASLHARIGECERALGRRAEAERAFGKALAIDATDRAAFDGLVDLASDVGDWTRTVALRRRRLALSAGTVERVDELFALARILVERLRDVEGAVVELQRARALDPAREDVLEATRRALRVLKRWPEALEVTDALITITADPKERAKLRLHQARIAIERLEDDDRGTAYLEVALMEDPGLDEARVLLAAVRGESSIAPFPAAMPSSLSSLSPLPTNGRTATPSGVQRREPAALDSRVVRADELVATGDETAAVAELETLAVQAPWDDASYARLHTLHLNAGRVDRAYLAALALEELAALDDSSQLTLERCRPERALRARASLDDAAWKALRAPGSDDVVESIFAAVSRAAIAAAIDDRRSRKALVALDPARRQSDTSTASIVRCFAWAAQVLAVASPDLYVLDDVPGEIAAVPLASPATAIGPGVLSGLSMKDLAFLTGRHMTYYRPEHQVLLYFPTLNELTVLLLACAQLVSPDMPVPSAVRQDVAVLGTRIEGHATGEELAAITKAVRRLEARGHRVNLAAWIRAVELTACRAGLFLAGDLRSAMGRVRAETRQIASVSADDRRADLLSFCASRVHADLRERFAVVDTPPAGERAVIAPPSLRAAG